MINPMVEQVAEHLPVVAACRLLGRSRAGHYRWLRPVGAEPARAARPAPGNALTAAERARVLAVLTSDRFVDKSVAQIWPDFRRW